MLIKLLKFAEFVLDKNFVYINNTSENKLLKHYEEDKAELGDNLKYHGEDVWKIGKTDSDGYFNLTHFESEKLLTATSSPSNALKVDKSTYVNTIENSLMLTANILL